MIITSWSIPTKDGSKRDEVPNLFIALLEKRERQSNVRQRTYQKKFERQYTAWILGEILMPDLLEESKRSDRFFGMRLNGKSIDDIENKFLAMFAEFVSLMALFIGMLGFGILLWAIFGG